jgi:hypothetical protein
MAVFMVHFPVGCQEKSHFGIFEFDAALSDVDRLAAALRLGPVACDRLHTRRADEGEMQVVKRMPAVLTAAGIARIETPRFRYFETEEGA